LGTFALFQIIFSLHALPSGGFLNFTTLYRLLNFAQEAALGALAFSTVFSLASFFV